MDAEHVFTEAVRGIGKEDSPGFPAVFVEQVRDKVFTRLGARPANAFTENFGPDFWKLKFTPARDLKKAVPDFFYVHGVLQACLRARPKCAECSLSPTTLPRRSSSQYSSRKSSCLTSGGPLNTEITRASTPRVGIWHSQRSTSGSILDLQIPWEWSSPRWTSRTLPHAQPQRTGQRLYGVQDDLVQGGSGQLPPWPEPLRADRAAASSATQSWRPEERSVPGKFAWHPPPLLDRARLQVPMVKRRQESEHRVDWQHVHHRKHTFTEHKHGLILVAEVQKAARILCWMSRVVEHIGPFNTCLWSATVEHGHRVSQETSHPSVVRSTDLAGSQLDPYSGKLNVSTRTRPELKKWFPIASRLSKLHMSVRTDAFFFWRRGSCTLPAWSTNGMDGHRVEQARPHASCSDPRRSSLAGCVRLKPRNHHPGAHAGSPELRLRRPEPFVARSNTLLLGMAEERQHNRVAPCSSAHRHWAEREGSARRTAEL